MEAAMNSAEASHSFSPLTLLKRVLERIHISRGMLKIRISVMELGRFTLRESPVASRNLVLIILLGKMERNGRKSQGNKLQGVAQLSSYQVTWQLPWRRSKQRLQDPITSGKSYFGAGAMAPALGCLA